ncbi:5-nucleotidase SurE [hydrothermal vent metagenome]|uniref:5-nucleotidase SurE n=1 Tax=hydrothermal vent metagenome TaxID=652676 RepID=A0A3B1E7Q0_9ZZZZ
MLNIIKYKFLSLIVFVSLLFINAEANASEFNILVTNDDSIHTPEIKHLVHNLQNIANVYVVAPNTNKSGTGRFLTPTWNELNIKPIYKHTRLLGHAIIDGYPADTVRIAVKKLYKDIKFDLIVSGINQGLNYGRYRYYSGTIGAAIESLSLGIPAIAISQYHNGGIKTTKLAAKITNQVVRYIKKNKLPEGILLNINIPSEIYKGIIFSPRKTLFKTELNALKEGYITISSLNINLDDIWLDNYFKHLSIASQ